MRMTKPKFVLVGLVLGGAAVMIALLVLSRARLRAENEALQQELAGLRSAQDDVTGQLNRAPRLSPPSASGVVVSPATSEPSPPAAQTRLRPDGRIPRLTAAELQPYLDANRRNAESLLAAYRTSGEFAFLQEAIEKFPEDPGVAFEAAFRPQVSGLQRRVLLEALKRATPDNPLGNYLSALDYFEAGQPDLAVQELVAAAERPRFDDFTLQRVKAGEEAYRASGYSTADAKTGAMWNLDLPHLGELRNLAQLTVEPVKSYRHAGDEPSAQAALEIVFGLGAQMDGGSASRWPLITALTGVAVQGLAIDGLTSFATMAGVTTEKSRDTLGQRPPNIRRLSSR